MEINEINNFIDSEIKRLEEYYSLKGKGQEEIILAMALKIGEEVGELFNEVLAHKGFQRKDKLSKLNKKEIESEIADVIFTTFILSRKFNINIDDAINEKMAKIKKRIYDKE